MMHPQEQAVRTDTCRAIHQGVAQRAGRAEQRLGEHDAHLRELSRIAASLATLASGQARRLDRLEADGAGKPAGSSFWTSDAGRTLIRGLFLLIAALLAAAVGGNVLAAAVKAAAAL